MSTITNKFTKEQLQQIEAAAKEVMWPVVWSEKKAREHFSEKITPKVVLKLARIALASLEAEPVAWLLSGGGAKNNVSFDSGNAYADPLREVTPLYTAPPAPVSVPDAIHSQGEKSASDDYYALGWNACRAAMLKHSESFIVTSDHRMMEMPQVEAINAVTAILQGADGTLTNEGTIPVTQFKPVADLYGLTSPTGGETSFTFDAVEARDFIDGGWSCQEYVELGRYQEAMLQNGNSPAQSDCCPEKNYIAPAQDGESPVIPDGWVACSERMPDIGTEIFYFCQDDGLRDCGVVSSSNFSGKGDAQLYVHAEGYDLRFGVDITHWMPLPAAPQQEADNG
ncbi:DUF551 domain-containing protein [Enterobacter hormaechei]|nr:DUF551 domain-containing protein [Enterobacter hormaechei]